MQFDYKNHYWVTIRDHSVTYVRIIFRKTNISNPLILTRTCVLLTRYRTGSNPQYAIPVVWIMILMPIGLHNKLEEWVLINLNQPVLEKKFISWNLISDINSGLEKKKAMFSGQWPGNQWPSFTWLVQIFQNYSHSESFD